MFSKQVLLMGFLITSTCASALAHELHMIDLSKDTPEIRTGRGFVLAPSIWQTKTIPVCWWLEDHEWNNSSYTQQRNAIRDAIADTWERYSSVRFTGWERCNRISDGNTIKITSTDHPDHLASGLPVGNPFIYGLGNHSYTMLNKPRMFLNFHYNNWSTSCKNDILNCSKIIAVHEFGHALGFDHEQNRPDTPSYCKQDKISSGNVMIGAWDSHSVMNYCNPVWSNSGVLSHGDIQMLQKYYDIPLPNTGYLTAIQLFKNSRLNQGQILQTNQKLKSPNGRYELGMQYDGNLVLRDSADNSVAWHSHTDGSSNQAHAVLQTDGNFVVYHKSTPLFYTNTAGSNAKKLSVSNSRTFDLHTMTPVFATYTQRPNQPFSSSGHTEIDSEQHFIFPIDQAITSGNGKFKLVMQSDGNLVLYDDNTPLWATYTQGIGQYAAFQNDGNLVIYNSTNTPIWSSNTGGIKKAILAIQDDGNLVIYRLDTVWSSRRIE